MIIRWNTTCPKCGKKNSVFERDKVCNECQIRGAFKSSIKVIEKNKRLRAEIREMKEPIRRKLHDEILEEVLKELDGQDGNSI